jgi:hypothetical protein
LPPEDPEPDDPPDEPDDPEPPDVPELGDPLIPPLELLPGLPDMPPLLDELGPLLLDDPELPEDPDGPDVDEAALPRSPSDWPLAGEALLPELDFPSPFGGLSRSRLSLLAGALFPPWLLLDEPGLFWSRSAMILSSKILWTSAGAEQVASLRALPSVPYGSAIQRPICPTHEGAPGRHCPV